MTTIEVGDYVTRGNEFLTWKVLEARPSVVGATYYVLQSGQSVRTARGWIDNLHLHTKGVKA